MTTKLIQELVNISTEVSYYKGGYADITRIKKGEDDFNTLQVFLCSSDKHLMTMRVNLSEKDAPEQLQVAIDKAKALS